MPPCRGGTAWSSACHDLIISKGGSVSDALLNIPALKIGVISEIFRGGHPAREQLEDNRHGNPKASNTRPPAYDRRIEWYAVK